MQSWSIAYRMFKNGFLPNNNGWLQQTNKFLEVVSFIDIEINKHNQEAGNGRK